MCFLSALFIFFLCRVVTIAQLTVIRTSFYWFVAGENGRHYGLWRWQAEQKVPV
jgi:hypothetical protein